MHKVRAQEGVTRGKYGRESGDGLLGLVNPLDIVPPATIKNQCEYKGLLGKELMYRLHDSIASLGI